MKLIWKNVIGIYVTNWEQKYNMIRIDIYITAIEPAVKLPVIWNAMTLMCRQCNCVGHLFGECQWLDDWFFSDHVQNQCTLYGEDVRWFCPFVQAQIKGDIKAPRHRPLWGECTGDRWILRTNGQLRGKCFHSMTSSMVIACQTSPRLTFLKVSHSEMSQVQTIWKWHSHGANTSQTMCHLLQN